MVREAANFPRGGMSLGTRDTCFVGGVVSGCPGFWVSELLHLKRVWMLVLIEYDCFVYEPRHASHLF